MTTKIPYDEFSFFHENASEFNLPWDPAKPPKVQRVAVAVDSSRSLSALKWGSGSPEIVFLHGGAQNAHTWDTVCLALGPRHENILCIDLPGHGHSDGPSEAQKGGEGPIGAAKDVATVIEQLAPAAKCIVGMSFGGMVSVALADLRPDVVRKLLLVDVLPGLQGGRGAHIVEFVDGPPFFPSFDDILARTKKFNPTRSESSLRRGILHNAEQKEDGSWVWRHSRWRVTDSAKPKGDQGRIAEELVAALGRVKVPVLLARGMRADSVLREDDEERLKSILPGAEIRRFQEAGHSIQGAMPVELAKCIDEFIG